MSSRCWQPAGGVADDAGIISVGKVVDGDGVMRESETKILPGAESVRKNGWGD